MDERKWWERLLDRDNPAGPIIVLVLLVLAIVLVLSIGPVLDRLIEGEPPESLVRPTIEMAHATYVMPPGESDRA